MLLKRQYNWEYPDHSHIDGHSCLVTFIWVHHLCDIQLVLLIGSAGNKCNCNTLPNEINAYPNPAYLKLRDFQDLCRHCHCKFSGEKSLSSNLYYHLCLWRENWSLLGENINYRYVEECCVLHKISIKVPQRKLERVILIYSYSSLTPKHLFNVFIYTYWAIQVTEQFQGSQLWIGLWLRIRPGHLANVTGALCKEPFMITIPS